MLVETLVICSLIFGLPNYDCDNTWTVQVYDDPIILTHDGEKVKSYITFIKGQSNSTKIYLGSDYRNEDWHGIPILWFYMISGSCQCDLNVKLQEAMANQTSLQKI